MIGFIIILEGGVFSMPEVTLRVDSAYPGDQGFGKVRLDPETILILNVSIGDIIAIEGKRRTVARVWRLLVEDWNTHKIRIDNFTRHNAGVNIGDTIKVVKIADEVEAIRVVLAPPDDLPKKIPIANNPRVVNGLIDFPVMKNDSVPIILRLPFIELQIVAFKLVEIEPDDAVIITKNTSVEFSNIPAADFGGIKHFSYEDIIGLNDELLQLRQIIELPLCHPELFKRFGMEAPKGVLLYGPPGTGKTHILKAVAGQSGAYVITIAGPEIISKYYGESEQRLREVFEEAQKNAPAIIIIDELESITLHFNKAKSEVEGRIVTQLLAMMDGLEERGNVIVIGATRHIDLIEPALRRSGRFDREIEIKLPDVLARTEILKFYTRNMPLSKDIRHRIEDLAQQTDGFSGADLVNLCREAVMQSVQRYLPDLNLDTEEIPAEVLNPMMVLPIDFNEAIKRINKKIIDRNKIVN